MNTANGLRCSVDTAGVRPFWGRALGWYGGAVVVLYVTGVMAVFAFLRTVGYPVSIVHIALPSLWERVGQARGWFFLERSNRAFAEGRTEEGLLYLENSYEFDPTNYAAGLALAKNLQAGRVTRSDEVFARLLREHPGKHTDTAQDWFRALLARGNFDRITTLSRDELLRGSPHGGVWMRALIFATRRTGDDAVLRSLLASNIPAARPWHPLLETELLLRSGGPGSARAVRDRPWMAGAPPFTLFHQVHALIQLGDPIAAVDLLDSHGGTLDDEAATTLRLDAYALSGARRLLQQQVNALLASRLNPPRIKLLCAHLIRRPDGELFQRLWRKLGREPLSLDHETAGAWFSLLCAAGAVGDHDRLRELTARLKHASNSSFIALGAIEAFFRGETAERHITAFLPILPVPLEVTYALLERHGPESVVPWSDSRGP